MHRLLLLLSALTLGGCDADAGSPSIDGSARLGSLEQSQISRVVTAHMPALNACYSYSLELDPELSCDDLRQLLDHASFTTTKLYLASSTAPGRRLLAQQKRRLQPPSMCAALQQAAPPAGAGRRA